MNDLKIFKMKNIKNIMKLAVILVCILLYIPKTAPVAATSPQTDIKLQLSDKEQALISRTKAGKPVSIGIIPYTFPLSDWPSNTNDYTGIIIELLNRVSELSGLQFAYYRIPVDEKTPYQVIQEGTVTLIAGTAKLDTFLHNSNLILSDRLSDGAAICIAKRGINPSVIVDGKLAVLKGYQAGLEFAQELFPSYKIISYSNNEEVMRAVRKKDVDMAIISRYVGIYEMQSPLNENLLELTMYKMEKDSCVMGINTPENRVAISIINKALSIIGEDGYNYIQMNFSLTHPYKPTFIELLYKYRHILLITTIALIIFYKLIIQLLYTRREHKRLLLDPLTGALTEIGFELMAANILSKSSKSFFIMDFDVYLFSSYNELNGKKEGDELLKNIVKIMKSLLSEQDIICRSYADNFKVLTSKKSLEALINDIYTAVECFNKVAKSTISLNFGIYSVTNNNIPISKMLDFAGIAKKYAKNDSNLFIRVFDEELHKCYIDDAKMISTFQNAIENKEFIAYYQPKFDAAKKTVIGAEALVRWISNDKTIIPPSQFIDLFEKSGQIQQLDFYMLEQVCIFLNNLIVKKIPLLPIAVNFSKVHLYNNEFVNEVKKVVEHYNIPKHLIEIECTETTMMNNIDLTRKVLNNLQEQGFSIAMDDFGSAYSSLNTLCSFPLDVLKLDRGFLVTALYHDKVKANIIIRSVINLAHDLSLKVVAEGVETEEQYEFLKSMGCDFIQGYYFSKPMDEKYFLKLLTQS